MLFRRSMLLVLFAGLLLISATQSSQDVRFEFSPSDLVVGEPVVVEMKIHAPKGGIAAGGEVFFPFYLKPWTGLQKGLSEDRGGNHLVKAVRSDGGKVAVHNANKNPKFDILSNLSIRFEGQAMPAGETLTVTFGTPDQPVTPRRKQRQLVVEAKLDAEGDGKFETLTPRHLQVASAEPHRLRIVVPSYARPGEVFEASVFLEDEADNVCEDLTVPVQVSWGSTDGRSGRMPSYTIRPWNPSEELDRNAFTASLARPGVYYLQAEARSGGATFEAVSNPIIVTEELPRRLYWGDFHIHTQLSDGRGELADVYRDAYGKGLDFVSISDHSFGRADRGAMNGRLSDICRQAERFNRPGRYVTFAGGETHYLPKNHVNFYFRESDAERMQAVLDRITAAGVKQKLGDWSDGQIRAAGQAYWDAIRQSGFERFPIVLPHHTMWQGVEGFLDGPRGRLIELFSVHGSSETRDQADIPKPLRMKEWRMKDFADAKYSAREALARGYRLGFVGGSDTHEGQPGQDALTGIWAGELRREDLFESLYSRQCYATSANRTIIEFRRDGQSVTGRVVADGELDRVEIIADGEVARTVELSDRRLTEFSWNAPAGTDYCYVRALLRDAEAAWSSPVWFDEAE